MGISIRWMSAAALAGVLLAGGAVPALPEGGKPPVPGPRAEKLRRLYRKLGYEELARAATKARVLDILRGDAKKTEEACAKVKWGPIDDFLLKELDTRVDDRTLDDVLPFLDTPEGQRTLSLVRLNRSLLSFDLLLTMGDAAETMDSLIRGFQKVVEKTLEETSPATTAELNETRAIASLRNLASCQAQIQTSGKIDADDDGIGEYGFFLELTGSTGVRKGLRGGVISGTDFAVQGTPVQPPILSSSFAAVDGNGIVTRNGYCFRIFLPDTGIPPAVGFVHEKGPASAVGLEGGTGRVGVTMSEAVWCTYAWPAKKGVSGSRAFFVNQLGDVMQSANMVAGWSGVEKAPPGNSAFTGKGIVSDVAVNVKGNDGDVWKFTD